MRAPTVLAVALTLSSFAPAYGYTAQQANACISDALRFCASEIPDIERTAKCLRSKRSALSSGCAHVFARGQNADFRERAAGRRNEH